MNKKPMTVDEMIERLKKLSNEGKGDFEIWSHDKGSMYDFPIGNIVYHPYDEKFKNKKIIVGR